jgi:hypothetical protein
MNCPALQGREEINKIITSGLKTRAIHESERDVRKLVRNSKCK